jgi:hypothetical protein
MSRFRTRLEGLRLQPASEEAERSARRQRKHCTGALTGEAHSRRTLAGGRVNGGKEAARGERPDLLFASLHNDECQPT